MVAFTEKLLSLTIGGVSIPSGVRASVQIELLTNSQGMANGIIYGLPLSTMNSMTILSGKTVNQPANTPITIQAGDSSGMSLCFSGNLIQGFVDAHSMPEVGFRFNAVPGANAAVTNIEPTSTQGSGDVATIAQKVAGQSSDLKFENNGISKKLSNPYLSGSLLEQLKKLMSDSNTSWTIDNGIFAAFDISKGRQGSGNVTLSKSTGMIGYPAVSSPQIIVDCYYNPAIHVGSIVTIESEITPANGNWLVMKLEAFLESLTPHGQWAMQLTLNVAGTDQAPGNQG